MSVIRFGTAGWRSIIAEDFTFSNLRLVVQSISEYFSKDTSSKKLVIVGYDTRFLSKDFADVACQILIMNGFEVYCSDGHVPTPVVSYAIKKHGAICGINITASHNSYEYSGLKFYIDDGSQALPSVTEKIEHRCNILEQEHSLESRFSKYMRTQYLQDKKAKLKHMNFFDDYREHINKIIDFDMFRGSKFSVALDCLYGTAQKHLDVLLKQGVPNVHVFNDYIDCFFGHISPEPSEKHLSHLISFMQKNNIDIGISTDGDADRFGIVDTGGVFLSPDEFLPLVLDYVLSHKTIHNPVVARSVMTTNFIDFVAKYYGADVVETPVGFKYIARKISEIPIVFGCEESGGMTIFNHIPEKDGILACLLALEIRFKGGKPLKELLVDLKQKVLYNGYTVRKSFFIMHSRLHDLYDYFEKNAMINFIEFKVKKIIIMDGYKFLLEDGSWVAFRISGTESAVRLYVESNSAEERDRLVQIGGDIIHSIFKNELIT